MLELTGEPSADWMGGSATTDYSVAIGLSFLDHSLQEPT